MKLSEAIRKGNEILTDSLEGFTMRYSLAFGYYAYNSDVPCINVFDDYQYLGMALSPPVIPQG